MIFVLLVVVILLLVLCMVAVADGSFTGLIVGLFLCVFSIMYIVTRLP